MEELFLLLVARLRATFPEVEYLGEDCGQLQLPAGDVAYTVSFPCVLFDLGECTWQCDKQNFVRGQGKVVVRLAFNCGEDAPSEEVRDADLRMRLDACERLWSSLNRYSFGASYSPLQLTHSRAYALPGARKVYETTFTVGVIQPLQTL